MTEIRRLIEVVQQADEYKQQQIAAIWPELADAVAGVIETMTEHDAPREWWTRAHRPMLHWMPVDPGESTVMSYPIELKPGETITFERTEVLEP